MGMVVEGIRTTQAAFKIAGQLGVEMPITSELHHVLFEGKSPKSAVEALMNRDPTHETDGIARASMREWFD